MRANVAGVDQSEIAVSVEPSRVMILGKKTKSIRTTEPGTAEPRGSHPDQILEVIDLATKVIPERATVEMQAGELILELSAVSKNKTAA